MRHPRLALPIALLLTPDRNAHAQDATIFANARPARWIAPAQVPGDSFTVFHARRTFELTAVPARFVVHVSADNRYRLYVNGAQVSSGPQRSDVEHWRGAGVTSSIPSSSSQRVPSSGKSSSMSIVRSGTGRGMRDGWTALWLSSRGSAYVRRHGVVLALVVAAANAVAGPLDRAARADERTQ